MLTLSDSWIHNPHVKATLTGASIGILGAAVALLLVLEGPVMTFGLVLGLLVGLYLLTSLEAALVVTVAIVALLPFGTFPVKIAFTPSLIDVALAGFLTVYLFQWMTGRRRNIQLPAAPVSGIIIAFMLTALFAFILGTGHSRPTANLIKTFVELLLNIGMALILVDVARDIHILRRVTLMLLMAGTLAAALGIMLWLLPDDLAEQALNRLGRFGYPIGGVIHYRQDGVSLLNERAIGTWIEPNAFGGFLLMVGGLAGAQIFTEKPVTRWRWLAFAAFGTIAIALLLSDSRGSVLGFAAGLGVIALLYHHRLLALMIAAGILALFLPVTQDFIYKIYLGLTAADLETQMRLGEYKDALILIRRYPLFGVGFSGVPEIDLYIGFSSTYLTLTAYTGLFGLMIFVLTILIILGWGLYHWQKRTIRQDDEIRAIWLGLLAGIIGALVGGIFDHFYFSPQYQATAFMFWSFIGMFLAATKIATKNHLA